MAHLPSHPAAEQATKSDVRELGRRMDRLEGRMDAFFAELREQGRSFQAEVRAQGRTFTLAVIGSVLTAAALAFGAAAVI